MKIRILSIVSILACLAFTGCGTPAQNVATANYLAGNAFATHELAKSPASLKGLQDLAAALPDMASGKVSPFQMGVLNAELSAIKADGAAEADAKTREGYSQVGSLISAGIQAHVAASGGIPTATDAIAGAALTDFASGINHGIAFWQGQRSVTAPPAP